jgi:hydroxypyruvate isomerase
MIKLSANLSILFPTVPVEERFAAAANAGFTDVETWWPFATPVPTTAELGGFLGALEASGLALRGLNFFAGDMAAGARGLFSVPGRTSELLDNIPVVKSIAEATGCRVFNALYGHRTKADDPQVQDDTAVRNLGIAARELGDLDGVIVLEALKVPENGNYPLTTLGQADAIRRRVIDEEHVGNIALLFDTFHLKGNGCDLEPAFTEFADRIGHIQYADFPGRGTPGSGSIDFPSLTGVIDRSRYSGYIGCEFVPGESHPDHDALLAAVLG